MGDSFRGTWFHRVDDKFRLAIPAKFRNVVKQSGDDSQMIVSKWDGHLKAYTTARWKEVEANIRARPNKNEQFRRFIRVFIGGAHECPFDKQGRILIPPDLREFAGIKAGTECALVGALENLEIWDKDRYLEQDQLLDKDLSDPGFKGEVEDLM